MRVTILGSGTSHGVPMIGCDCSVCTSDDPHDSRTRSSVLVQVGERCILIDTTPELRIQCIANNVRQVDAVLFTHGHADHVTGLDDLRRFNWLQRTSLTCYADATTAGILRRMFPYAFDDSPDYPSSKPQLKIDQIIAPFELFGTWIVPVSLFHGQLPILGFRIGRFAYCTDCSLIPEDSMRLLQNLDVLVLDALRHRPHPTHFNLEQAITAATQIGARQTYFTHIAHELPHAATNATLPAGMRLAYDGQVIEISGSTDATS